MNTRISKLKDQLRTLEIKRELLLASIEQYSSKIVIETKLERNLHRSTVVLEYIIEKKYGTVLKVFEDTITSGLQELFNDEYSFRMNIDRSGTNCVCSFEIATDKCPEHQDLKMTQGRSVQEIIACLIRLVICKLDNRIMKVIILDEPFGGLKPFRAEKAAEFLQKICKEFEMQIIIVTQIQEMCDFADNSIDLAKIERKMFVC